ncbi:MAG: hypothetical protein ACRCWS_09000 [Propionibacteriaceae bacterium]
MGIFSNLDLHGSSSYRAQPKVGQWGPTMVPSTGFKKFQRWFVYVAFVLVLTGVIAFGYYTYKQLTGA